MPPKHFGFNKTWGKGRFDIARVSAKQNTNQNTPGGETSPPSFGRIFGGQGSGKKSPWAHKAQNPLVCDQERREWWREVKAYCRLQNSEPIHGTKAFQTGPLENIFPYLQKGMWCAKIDLKHAYFHLGLSDQLREFVNLEVGENIYQFQAAAFGLSPLPQKWMRVMHVFSKIWRRKGIMCFIYLDDILVINTTPQGVKRDLAIMMQTLKRAGMVVNTKKEYFGTNSNSGPFGIYPKFEGGAARGAQNKNQNCKKRDGKNFNSFSIKLQKNGCHFGQPKKFFGSNAMSESFYRPNDGLCKQTQVHGLGQGYFDPRTPKTRGEGSEQPNSTMERETFPSKSGSENIAFRQLRQSMGWDRYQQRGKSARILETEGWTTHKCKRVGSCHFNGKKFGKAHGCGPPLCGQQYSILVSQKRGETTPSKPHDERFLGMVSENRSHNKCGIGEIRTGPGRFLVQTTTRQGGLYPQQGASSWF